MPPTSIPLAGVPPFDLVISVVDNLSSPFRMQPISPNCQQFKRNINVLTSQAFSLIGTHQQQQEDIICTFTFTTYRLWKHIKYLVFQYTYICKSVIWVSSFLIHNFRKPTLVESFPKLILAFVNHYQIRSYKVFMLVCNQKLERNTIPNKYFRPKQKEH